MCFELIRFSYPAFALSLVLISASIAQEGTVAQDSIGSETAVGSLVAEDAGTAVDSFGAEAERAAFTKAIDAWEETIGETREVLIRFHNGTAETESLYRDRYRELQVRGRQEFDRAVRSATALLERVPGDSSPHAQFLLAAVQYRYDHDWFELTGRAAEALLEVEPNNPKLSEVAGVSFFATGQFDRAEPHLVNSAASGTLNPKHAGLPEAIEAYRAYGDRERQLREQDREQDDLPRVRFSTTRGEILIELFEDQAPNTVANFIHLVESGHYEYLPFYQVIASQIAMVGDFEGDGSGMANGRIADENQGPDARVTFRGSLAMAKLPNTQSPHPRTIPDTASSHFFFTLMPLPEANSEYTVFGRVIEGIDTVSALRRVDLTAKDSDQTAAPPDRVLSAEVVRKRSHAYRPEFVDPSPARSVRGSANTQPSEASQRF